MDNIPALTVVENTLIHPLQPLVAAATTGPAGGPVLDPVPLDVGLSAASRLIKSKRLALGSIYNYQCMLKG